MDIRIVIGNRAWVVPSANVGSLIAWLTSNAVELGNNRNNSLKEDVNDTRQLILEGDSNE